jgi:8-oxo-dGTP diphosphatase
MKLIPGLILAAGGIVIDGGQVLVVHRTKHQDWTLPKGKLDEGETPLEAALREVREETGYAVNALRFVGACGYIVGETPKVVLYWLMAATGKREPVMDPSEIALVEWLAADDALKRLSYPLEREMLERALGG